MVDVIKPLTEALKFKNLNGIITDNFVFRLHYKLTVILLLACATVVSAKQFFGDPIYCLNHGGTYKDSIAALNNYCWIFGTFTVKSRYEGVQGVDNIYPGVGESSGDDQIYHVYYQWVSLVLLIEAAMFYAPHILWKLWEGEHIKKILGTMHAGNPKPLSSEMPGLAKPKVNPLIGWREDLTKPLAEYLCDEYRTSRNTYAYKFAICEIINLCNVVLQMFLLNRLFNDNFYSYGAAVAAFNHQPARDIDPTAWLFPKITKCAFNSYGKTGSGQKHDFLCILPLNVINEKIFVLVWFWFIFLAVVSFLAVVYRFVIYGIRILRVNLLLGQVRSLPRRCAETVVRAFSISDWLFLHQLGLNMNPLAFRDLILTLSNELDPKSADL